MLLKCREACDGQLFLLFIHMTRVFIVPVVCNTLCHLHHLMALFVLFFNEFHYVGNENYTGIAARDTANALAVLAHAVRGVAAGTKNAQTQEYILSTAQQVRVWPVHGQCVWFHKKVWPKMPRHRSTFFPLPSR